MKRLKTILIVRRDEAGARTTGLALEPYGYASLAASTPEEALAILESSAAVDLALVDTDLGPRPDGVDGIATARILQRERDIPVVLVDAGVEGDIVRRLGLVDSYGYVDARSGSAATAAAVTIAFQRREAERKARADGLRKILAAVPDIISARDR